MLAKRSLVLVGAVGLSLLALFLSRAPNRPPSSPLTGAPHDAGGGEGGLPRPWSPLGEAVDCREFVPSPRACTPLTDDPLWPVIRAANDLTISAGPCATSSDRSGEWQKGVLLAFERLARVDPASLPVIERVVAQNAALRLGLCAPRGPGLPGAEVARVAVVQVARFALSSAQLSRLGTEPSPEIAKILGGPIAEERMPINEWAFHERGYALTKVSRLLRVGDRLMNLSQLVAIDSEYKAHLTPIVGSLEIRGTDAAKPNLCAASLDVLWSRCGAPLGLRPLLPGRPVEEDGSILFATDRGGGRCFACHYSLHPLSRELAPDAGLEAPARRREKILANLSVAVAELRAQIRER